MNKKLGISAIAVIAALSLAACSSNNQSGSSANNKSTSSKVEKKHKVSEPKQSSETKAHSSASIKKNKKTSSQAPEESRFSKLSSQLHKALPGMLLPTRDGLGTGSNNVNVRYTSDNNTNVVYYSVGNSAVAFNADSVKNEKPYAVLTEKRNMASADADSFINYIPEQKGLPTTKLDTDTTATIQGAAGQKYIQWNKDNWSFVIQASNIVKTDPTTRAKSVLALSKQYKLPTTTSHASLNVTIGDSIGSLNTTIAWQDGHNVYQIKAHDTETAFKMLSSLK